MGLSVMDLIAMDLISMNLISMKLDLMGTHAPPARPVCHCTIMSQCEAAEVRATGPTPPQARLAWNFTGLGQRWRTIAFS
jgi:hypothetical protein